MLVCFGMMKAIKNQQTGDEGPAGSVVLKWQGSPCPPAGGCAFTPLVNGSLKSLSCSRGDTSHCGTGIVSCQ